ncbi:PAP2 superfamily-domain-containing protein [Calycina marina]|uniref:PAP2 superfamily-domain-containing protein n=1 Tax=Calycina marina TaxID=1763456 RepID=A0A9P7Z017_9HELO|nr:PAP2 superfamily-domain-containing protein [Calycina marina]
MALTNNTMPEPDWGNTAPAWRLPGWAEPIMVASILVASMVFTRKKNYRVFDRRRKPGGILDDADSARSSDDLLARDYMLSLTGDSNSIDSMSTMKNPPKKRRVCGVTLLTPNTERFADYCHSRILQKYPFLMEMFYWVITYGFYRCTSLTSQAIFSKTGIWDVAQDHGLAILEFEQYSWASFLWPVKETSVQQWFMNGHETFMTVLNRSYALIHIPGTVGFIAWYYYVAPSHPTFATVRRTMTLTNLFAFMIFISYPCMPPRLLPQEYGFLDTVGRNKAESVWMSGKYVNSLAAMPSMHFGYSFIIGCTFLYHSGVFRKSLEAGERRKSAPWAIWYCLLAVAYPSWILLTIVATANHYYLDACAAFFVALAAYAYNRVFLALLPLEDLLLWCLRLNKPKPTTGDRFRQNW